MILRLSQKLSTKPMIRPLQALPLADNPYADWSCHLFTADRKQYVLLTNTESHHSCLMHGSGLTNASVFGERALSCLRECLEFDGQTFVYRKFIAPATGPVGFTKALNRSVTGSMNDLINHVKAWLAEGELSPFDVGFSLNDVLLSSLARSKFDFYRKPREAFKDLVNALKQ